MADVLLTAGATRNPIDSIRYISASSTGRTGCWLAARLAAGNRVRLLGSAEACLRAEDGFETEEFGSTRDLMARMARWVEAHPRGVVIHAAAVGDYEVAVEAGKIPSGQAELTLQLQPTPKILARIRAWSAEVFLVSFKAAPPDTGDAELIEIARRQQQRSDSDLVFANVIGRLSQRILLLDRVGERWIDTRAAAMAGLLERIEAACGLVSGAEG